jgi:tetratricopeptide (TPR) repeat protein
MILYEKFQIASFGHQTGYYNMRAYAIVLLGIAMISQIGCSSLIRSLEKGSATGNAPTANESKIAQTELLPAIAPKYQQEGEVLYLLLVGEIAGQRAQLNIAVDSYLEAAAMTDDPEVAERATRLASFSRDYHKAMLAAERWAQLKPDELDVHQTLVILYIRNDKLDKAVDAAERVLALTHTKQYQGYENLIALMSNESNQAAVLEVMGKLAAAHPDNANAHFAYASLALNYKEDKIARREAEKALSLQPDNAQAESLLARILMVEGETEPALKIMDSVVRKHPDSTSYRAGYARLLAIAKRYDKAQEQFEIILKKEPDDSDVLYAVALLTLEQRKLKDSEAYFKRLMRTGKHTQESFFYLGNINETRKQYDKAIHWYSQVQNGSNFLSAHMRVAQLLAKQGHLDQARNYLHDMHSSDPTLNNRLAIAEVELLSDARQYQDAMQVVNKALESAPNDKDLLYSRSLLAEKMGNLPLAEADLRKILATEPDNVHALNALGYTLADRTTRYQEALGYIKRALELDPDEPSILDSMGWVLYRLGRYDEAIGYLTRAHKLLPDDEIAAHLGEVLWVSGNHKEADQVWQRALKDTPDSEHIHDVIRRLKTK